MNLNQAEYLFGAVTSTHFDRVTHVGALGFLFLGGMIWTDENPLLGALAGAAALIPFVGGYTPTKARILNFTGYPGIASPSFFLNDKDKYPLQNVDDVVVRDIDGLDVLMAKTEEGEKIEWGTPLSTSCVNDIAVVDEIVDPVRALERGFIEESDESSLRTNARLLRAYNYNGFQHFHPGVSSENFALNQIDKLSFDDWLNLLTFNTRFGPEVIAFNRRFTYIPVDDSKTRLKRAGFKDIWNYLGAK